jgi:hypothetical protein
VIALLLFAMIAIFLLDGHARAANAVLRMQVEREMAELLRLRLDLAALEHEEYTEGTTDGVFPSTISTRIVDEEKVLGDRFPGYRWEVTITPMLGAGNASGTVEVQDDRAYEPLFAEESGGTASAEGNEKEKEDAAVVQPEDIDRMLFIQVTVFPPGYDPAETAEDALQPRSAWTAVFFPPDEEEEGAGGTTR